MKRGSVCALIIVICTLEMVLDVFSMDNSESQSLIETEPSAFIMPPKVRKLFALVCMFGTILAGSRLLISSNNNTVKDIVNEGSNVIANNPEISSTYENYRSEPFAKNVQIPWKSGKSADQASTASKTVKNLTPNDFIFEVDREPEQQWHTNGVKEYEEKQMAKTATVSYDVTKLAKIEEVKDEVQFYETCDDMINRMLSRYKTQFKDILASRSPLFSLSAAVGHYVASTIRNMKRAHCHHLPFDIVYSEHDASFYARFEVKNWTILEDWLKTHEDLKQPDITSKAPVTQAKPIIVPENITTKAKITKIESENTKPRQMEKHLKDLAAKNPKDLTPEERKGFCIAILIKGLQEQAILFHNMYWTRPKIFSISSHGGRKVMDTLSQMNDTQCENIPFTFLSKSHDGSHNIYTFTADNWNYLNDWIANYYS